MSEYVYINRKKRPIVRNQDDRKLFTFINSDETVELTGKLICMFNSQAGFEAVRDKYSLKMIEQLMFADQLYLLSGNGKDPIELTTALMETEQEHINSAEPEFYQVIGPRLHAPQRNSIAKERG